MIGMYLNRFLQKNVSLLNMKTLKYIIYKEGKHFVSQCLNVDVASFGASIEEAAQNLKEALDLYFEDEQAKRKYRKIQDTLVGELSLRF